MKFLALPLLSSISESDTEHALFAFVAVAIACGLLWYLASLLPTPFNWVLRVLTALGAVIFLLRLANRFGGF